MPILKTSLLQSDFSQPYIPDSIIDYWNELVVHQNSLSNKKHAVVMFSTGSRVLYAISETYMSYPVKLLGIYENNVMLYRFNESFFNEFDMIKILKMKSFI